MTDAGYNLLPNIPVTFTVTEGSGRFSNGEARLTVNTDSDGRASAQFIAGPEQGFDTQRVIATIANHPTRAGFTISALMPGDSGQTRISGVVLDNQDRPMPQVTVRIEGSTRQAVTNADGQFRIEQAPVGPVHLIVEGSTTTRSGEWPSLGYHLITVPGVDNLSPSPVYLVEIDTQHAVRVGEQDAVVTLRYSILYPRHPRRLRYLSRWQQKRLSLCHLSQCQQSAHATAQRLTASNGRDLAATRSRIRSAGKTHLTQLRRLRATF